MLKKNGKKIGMGVALALGMLMYSQPAHAVGTALFTLPTDFADNVTVTLTGIAGVVLVVLGFMFAWRKTVKSVNRS